MGRNMFHWTKRGRKGVISTVWSCMNCHKFSVFSRNFQMEKWHSPALRFSCQLFFLHNGPCHSHLFLAWWVLYTWGHILQVANLLLFYIWNLKAAIACYEIWAQGETDIQLPILMPLVISRRWPLHQTRFWKSSVMYTSMHYALCSFNTSEWYDKSDITI